LYGEDLVGGAREARQKSDLHLAREVLNEAFPGLQVQTYFARLQESGVTFDTVL